MKRILVGLDSSPRASMVLDTAARLASQARAKLVLFRAIGLQPDLPRELIAVPEIEVEKALRAAAEEDLHHLARTVDAGLIERVTTELATAWDGIVRQARDLDVDLIVIGSHGYGGLDRLLGTTAAKVVNHADRNVMIVRRPL